MPNCNSDVFSYGWTISNYMGNEMMNGYELSALFFSMMAGMALMIWAMKRTTNTLVSIMVNTSIHHKI